ncbi:MULTISPECIES: ParA family protein [Gordonia]|uniref:ParA family protein n=1 Tax=Gordonia TaxID=2053 RepID=UPI00095A7459|nr:MULTISPECIES: ParA family protein [Gordonia]MBR7194631.1 ParA family protein [Gordonia sp. SCSIO 19800]OLT48682.1 chromosome partitioning protein ParA [Gordonia sp. CNJ-863]TSD93500.1 ParA family protein [Gordonia rubripertincta]
MAKIVVHHSRKGGVGKSTGAYELAYLLDAVLVDFEHDGGGVTGKWGYRPLERLRIPILDAFESGRTPRPLKGHGKPRLVPGHPDLYDQMPQHEVVADALERWAKDWDTEWVVVDTHPGISPAAFGALSVAHAVIVPTPLRNLDLTATEELINDMPDYPLIISPTMIPPVPPEAELRRLAKAVEGTPVQVGPPVPRAVAVERRTKRIAITSENPPAKALQPVAEAYEETAKFVQEYVR